MRKLQPEIVENLPGNPLPDAFEVTPVDGKHAKEIGRNLRAPTLPPGIEKINDGGAVSDRVVTVARVLSSCVPRRDDRAPDLVRAPDREHDPALDLLAEA